MTSSERNNSFSSESWEEEARYTPSFPWDERVQVVGVEVTVGTDTNKKEKRRTVSLYMYDILIHLVKFALTASKLTNDWKGE